MSKTARVAWANIGRGVLLAFTLELPWPRELHWAWDIVNWGSFAMVVGGAATLMVYGLVNVVRGIRWAYTDDPPYECTRDRLLREHQEEEDALAASQDALARIALANKQADAFRAGLERALAAGTASVNGVLVPPGTRYLGPPPVLTHPRGLRLSAECDECWEPMDAALVPYGLPRLCSPCLTHGMPGYRPY